MKTDNINLGNLIDPQLIAERDAIHIAVIPVVAGEDLQRGARVAIESVKPGADPIVREAHRERADKTVGIIDPFLNAREVPKGKRVWMLLLPYTITSLRHEWTHPSIETAQEPTLDTKIAKRAQRVLEPFVIPGLGNYGPSQDTIADVLKCIKSGDLFAGDDASQGRADENKREIMWAYSVLTGEQPPEDIYFSCAC